MISRFPFKLEKNEKLMSVIITTLDQKMYYSIICKNTDLFSTIEKNLYSEYPQYLESNHYFMSKGLRINRFKSLEDNKIKNSDIITLNYTE